MTELHL